MEQYRSFLALLRTALWGADRYPLELDAKQDWEQIFKELTDHGITALTTDVVAGIKELQPKWKIVWMQIAAKKINYFQRLMKEQQSLSEMFCAAGIPYCILKGSAAAMYYPNPEYRAMGDVDIIVPPEDFERALQGMLEHGFEPIELEDERHAELQKNGIIFELHHYFATLGDLEAAEILDQRIYEGTRQPVEERLGDFTFSRLQTLENGLVLLAHIDQHLESGIGLRQMIDWMYFVDKELDDAFWKNEFETVVTMLGLKKLALGVTRMCQMYLGLRTEGITWCKNIDEQLCQELMMMTMKKGNFGRKDADSSQTKYILGMLRSWWDIPVQLQLRGLNNWKALKKYPFLKPFAWVYQICHYLRKGFSRKNPFGSLMQDSKEHLQEKDILEKLEVSNRNGSKATVERLRRHK